jgi:hypothetical protein
MNRGLVIGISVTVLLGAAAILSFVGYKQGWFGNKVDAKSSGNSSDKKTDSGTGIIIENIDYNSKTVKYKMTAGGYTFSGTKLFSDKKTTEQKNGAYTFGASSEGKGFVLVIYKGINEVLKMTTIDLQTKNISTEIKMGT